jgi:hypothetical protein
MAKVPPRPSSEVIRSISEKAARVREAATAVTKRIERFQALLAELPGRIETDFYGDHPDAKAEDAGLYYLVLRLHRKGKDWALLWDTYHENYANMPDWREDFQPLVDAPLKIKMAAVKLFAQFLEAIETSQDKMTEQLTATVAEYDKFEASLKQRNTILVCGNNAPRRQNEKAS